MNNLPVFDYEDIQLVPNKCIINSRSEADTSVKLGEHTQNNTGNSMKKTMKQETLF